ncbi:Clp protease N-terminal domain-containing protein [Nocardia sp. CDC160]|uniref:Clp protease N-terminal domain-containing protein n=1 Tax=Nocardia sp. CDC160 TaxID=3112166 RepID=UPI002DC0010E|nr:Clp protease N-terminal domain-containing protein [Nocardia sp. CDC160]MEC3918877.1 Clp protease N-terminal domain-containing protein [Nocardia sp. CDC160]
MYELFTEPSRAILVEAQDLAQELGTNEIGVGHLLFGCAEVRTETAAALRKLGITSALIRTLLPHPPRQTPAGIDPEALRAVGIDYDQVRAAAEETFGVGALDSAPDRRASSTANQRPPFTDAAKLALELSLRVSTELHHRRVHPAHLVLALLRLDDELVSQILNKAGTTPTALSAATLTVLSEAA